MKNIICIVFVFSYLVSSGQNKTAAISLELSSDTVGMNGSFEAYFTIENTNVKKFNVPDFEGFNVLGPSTSSSMSIINGDMSQKTTYTFQLTPKGKGVKKIGIATALTEGGELKTDEKQVVVLDHYEPITKPKKRQHSFFDDDDEDNFFYRRQQPQKPKTPQTPEKTKKKYDTEKI